MNRKEKKVALVIDAHKPFDRQILAGIARFVRAAPDWQIYVESDPELRVPDLRRWRGDGILANLDDAELAALLAASKIPLVGIGGAATAADLTVPVPYVATDNVAIGRLAAEHLLERGFRSFAYLGARHSPRTPWSRVRQEAFTARVERVGAICSTHIGRHAPRNWEAMQRDLTTWLRSLPRPVGIMACNDARAHHLLEACRRLEIAVPDAIAVIGTDDDELLCELAKPQLSSVHQGAERIGEAAAAMLDGLMQGRSPEPLFTMMPPRGISTRASTDIVAHSNPQIAHAVAFIRDHLADRLRVRSVARHVAMSRSSLDERFR
ncbi:MAG: substrate-binding domain-containing protein, partial [bacterium]